MCVWFEIAEITENWVNWASGTEHDAPPPPPRIAVSDWAKMIYIDSNSVIITDQLTECVSYFYFISAGPSNQPLGSMNASMGPAGAVHNNNNNNTNSLNNNNNMGQSGAGPSSHPHNVASPHNHSSGSGSIGGPLAPQQQHSSTSSISPKGLQFETLLMNSAPLGT